MSYDPRVKHDVLGVPQEVIDDPDLGVVSAPCAEQMARGARSLLACDVAVSVTGIAGPDGGSGEKPSHKPDSKPDSTSTTTATTESVPLLLSSF